MEPTLPSDVPHPSTFSDGRLQEVLRAVLQEGAENRECECNTCVAFNREVRREATKRGLTGLSS